MAMKDLTDVFVLMRNNALQTKNIYAMQNISDNRAILQMRDSQSFEMNRTNLEDKKPLWFMTLDATHPFLITLRNNIEKLVELRSKKFTRPTLDDDSKEDHQFDSLHTSIINDLETCNVHIHIIERETKMETRPAVRRLGMSVIMALSIALQDLFVRYRNSQNDYLQQVKSREERNKPFFDEEQTPVLNGSVDLWHSESSQEEDSSSNFLQQGQQKQETILNFDEKRALDREKDIGYIVHIVSELNRFIKQISTVVYDQGTVLDRIDYNIEQTQVEVHEGYQQLKKADSYQRSNRKMYCIILLSIAIIFVSFLFLL